MAHYRTGRNCKAGDGMGSPGPGLAGRLALYPRALPAACRWLPGATRGPPTSGPHHTRGSVGRRVEDLGGWKGKLKSPSCTVGGASSRVSRTRAVGRWAVGRVVEGGRLPALVQAVCQARGARLAQWVGSQKSQSLKIF